ncbi:hypothetical protein GA0115246_102345 [Streptomyces sp. SolWspMP-sol7th]|nr:hypothetical protein [Streptomyces sp. SolWspMP-sol7th]SCD48634.1 hypothetical protein GA0115246_102345 [Streptomyces sp. SolWspMP-sol7th]
MAGFTLTTRIAAPPETVFDVSLDVDLHQASMAGSGERAGRGGGRRAAWARGTR